MKTEDNRLVIYLPLSDSRNDKKALATLLNKPSAVIEVSLPTPKVPTLIRVETTAFSLRFKREKTSADAWIVLGTTLAQQLKSIKPGSTETIAMMSVSVSKEGSVDVISDPKELETYKCLSRGWFKVEESVEFIDFFDII